jgi:hypothetical protein
MFDLREVTLRIWNVYGWNVNADGYKDIAKRMGLPRSAVRYGRQVIQMDIGFAVVAGWVSDQRVVGMLYALPLHLAKLIVRVETKLKRKLTRSRLAKLILAYEAEWAKRKLREVSTIRNPVLRAIPVNITNWPEECDCVY